MKAAERAVAAGVDCIIAQGVEAGGHIAGTVRISSLLLLLLLFRVQTQTQKQSILQAYI